jgi:hypothetical protein
MGRFARTSALRDWPNLNAIAKRIRHRTRPARRFHRVPITDVWQHPRYWRLLPRKRYADRGISARRRRVRCAFGPMSSY